MWSTSWRSYVLRAPPYLLLVPAAMLGPFEELPGRLLVASRLSCLDLRVLGSFDGSLNSLVIQGFATAPPRHLRLPVCAALACSLSFLIELRAG
jgi:hypothetical protein